MHFANALGLEEDDDLSSDSGDDTDRDSDGRPTDPDDNPALAVQDFQFVAQSDLRQPLTYVHPAVKAVGGASGVSESNMAYDVIEEAYTLDTDTGTPTRDEPPGVAADT